jgi:hypothetical protein
MHAAEMALVVLSGLVWAISEEHDPYRLRARLIMGHKRYGIRAHLGRPICTARRRDRK